MVIIVGKELLKWPDNNIRGVFSKRNPRKTVAPVVHKTSVDFIQGWVLKLRGGYSKLFVDISVVHLIISVVGINLSRSATICV